MVDGLENRGWVVDLDRPPFRKPSAFHKGVCPIFEFTSLSELKNLEEDETEARDVEGYHK